MNPKTEQTDHSVNSKVNLQVEAFETLQVIVIEIVSEATIHEVGVVK